MHAWERFSGLPRYTQTHTHAQTQRAHAAQLHKHLMAPAACGYAHRLLQLTCMCPLLCVDLSACTHKLKAYKQLLCARVSRVSGLRSVLCVCACVLLCSQRQPRPPSKAAASAVQWDALQRRRVHCAKGLRGGIWVGKCAVDVTQHIRCILVS